MSEFLKVRTKDDLAKLDDDEMLAGYRAGCAGDPEPGNQFSRSYWHGWRNGASDFKHKEIDDAQRELVSEIVKLNIKDLH